jgi:ABC-type uncharacterized transport system permease subunit
MLAHALPLLALLVYLATAGLALREARSTPASASMAVTALAALAVLLHASGHLWRALLLNGPELHFFAALSLVALGMAAISLADGVLRRVNVLLGVVLPLAALATLPYALLAPQARAALSWQIELHAGLALLAYAVLSVAALLAVLLWLQERALRARQLAGKLRGLPPLVQTEGLLFRSLWVAFVLLGLTLVTGVLYVEDLLAQHLAHKTVLSVLSWGVLAVLLFGRWRFGWRGRRAVRLTLLAMGLLLLAFFGSNLVLELILARK